MDLKKKNEETPTPNLPEKVLFSNKFHNIFLNDIQYYSVTFGKISHCAYYFFQVDHIFYSDIK